MGIIWAITSKDLRQRMRDRSALLMMFVVPFGLMVVFDLVFGGVTGGGLDRLDIEVIAEDDGDLGAPFASQYLPVVVDLLAADGMASSLSTPAGLADPGRPPTEADVRFVVPADFTQRLRSGQDASIDVYGRDDRGLALEVAAAIAEQYVLQVQGQLAAEVVVGRVDLDDEQRRDLIGAVTSVDARVALVSVPASTSSLDTTTYLAAGMAIFFLFFTVQFGVLSYLGERQDGTLVRLEAAPIPRWHILAGKALTSLVVGLVSVITLMVAADVLLGAHWGAPLPVLLLVVFAVLSATAIVSVVTAVATTPEQANVWQSVIAIVLGMFGGAFFPIAQDSGFVLWLSRLTPHAWFIDGLGETSTGGGLADVVPALVAMATFGVVVASVGILLSRRTS